MSCKIIIHIPQKELFSPVHHKSLYTQLFRYIYGIQQFIITTCSIAYRVDTLVKQY